MTQLFETFDMKEKVKELVQTDFTEKKVAIMVPNFDESGRLIKEEDPVLYHAQKRDASYLLHEIILRQGIRHIEILSGGDEANEKEKVFDHLILLHEFIPSEETYIIEGLCENNLALFVTKLY